MELLCVRCWGESKGMVKAPATFIYNGASLCSICMADVSKKEFALGGEWKYTFTKEK